jgi:hypothetical protein
MLDELDDLRRQIHSLEDEELWQMVHKDADQYRQVALDYARVEMRTRGLATNPTVESAELRVGPYTARWDEYRKTRNLFWLVFLTYLPGVAIIGIPLARLSRSRIVFFVTLGLWWLAFMATGLSLSFWKCPRCRKRFFSKWWYHNSFARKCVHCKLPKWAPADPG